MSLANAKATGRFLHYKKRFENRAEPVVKDPLGKPPKWMKKASQKEAWNTLNSEIPWLNSSHRGVMGIVAQPLTPLSLAVGSHAS
jgi:hypothetical protein